MRPTAFTEYKFQEMTQAHQSENDRLRELLKEALDEADRLLDFMEAIAFNNDCDPRAEAREALDRMSQT